MKNVLTIGFVVLMLLVSVCIGGPSDTEYRDRYRLGSAALSRLVADAQLLTELAHDRGYVADIADATEDRITLGADSARNIPMRHYFYTKDTAGLYLGEYPAIAHATLEGSTLPDSVVQTALRIKDAYYQLSCTRLHIGAMGIYVYLQGQDVLFFYPYAINEIEYEFSCGSTPIKALLLNHAHNKLPNAMYIANGWYLIKAVYCHGIS